MIKKAYFKSLLVALGVIVLSSESNARFFDVMTSHELTQEIRLWTKSGMSLTVITQAALNSGVSPERLTSSMIESGQDAATVVAAVINVDPKSASSIVAAAIRAVPAQSKAIYAAALTATGLDPSIALPATAARGDAPVERH